ncbi:MAG TPA: hypothetical protein PLR99_05690 [Polyangiaceae bacterium]|nr:hypothetical protein [Polyangiaceae bacterium]
MSPPVRLEPRGDRPAPVVFREGATAPYGIRWYGATSLWGHFRNLVSTAIAREAVDARDWMRPASPEETLRAVAEVLRLSPDAPTLLEGLGRPLWVDWVADTGDDRDVSAAVGRMLFAEYVVDGGEAGEQALPRGDVLLFGGDTAYPVATADEIFRRVLEPWNELLEPTYDPAAPPRALLAIPGNHDWYDGLDGFGRLFRRSAGDRLRGHGAVEEPRRKDSASRAVGLVARGLHLDELGGTLSTIAGVAKTTRALWRGTDEKRRRRLTLLGYEPVQEASYWALPLAPGLDLWGVDRQLGRLDYRQRSYFAARRRVAGGERVWLASPDPAIAFGEPWDVGERILAAAGLDLARDRVLYQCGDMHHYERRVVGESMHVIAGGGGAFLHGTRIVPDPSPAAAAYPSARISRRLALEVPLRLVLGRSGYIVHIVAAVVGALELAAGGHGLLRFGVTAAVASAAWIWVLYAIAGHHRAHPRRVLALTLPFGLALGLLPAGLALLEVRYGAPLHAAARGPLMVLVHAYASALIYGVFLALCALGGLEMQQVFTVLGHPGFKSFVRMRVSPSGTIDAWVIGKDDPLASTGPWLVDRWTWGAPPRDPAEM